MTNNGVGNPTISCNATVDNAGKIGKCYVCASGNHISFTNPITTSTTDFAISCWVYITEYTSGYSNVFSSRTATSGKGLALWIQSGSIRFDDGEMWSVSNTFTLNTWTHICVTYSKTSGKSIYVNGNLIGSKTTVGTLANLRSELFIGYDHYGYYLGGKINDLRVWEGSTPSPKEVEILARGLVLHYPLSLPMPNLAKGSNTDSTSTNSFGFSEATGGSTRTIEYDGGIPCAKITRNSTAHGSWSYLWYSNWDRSAIKPSTTYTLSFDIIGSGSGTIGFSGFMQGNATNNISASVETIQNTFSAGKWSHLVFRTTTIADFTDKGTSQTIYMNCSYLHNTDVWIMMKNMKLEEGVNDTPWIPHTSDAGYSTMGLGSTTEYDVSGYNYHGTKIGSPTYSSDTPRYSTSTSFNGVDDCIQVPLNTFFPNAGSFTINLWLKKHELGSKNYETVFGGISGFEIDTRKNSSTTLSYYVTGNNRGLTVQSPLNFDTWYMLTMVCDGTNELYYLNGEYKKQIEKKGMPTGNYFIGAWNSATQQNFKGLISDFRVYATALTATQIAELYNTSASISNNGTLMGYEFVEQ